MSSEHEWDDGANGENEESNDRPIERARDERESIEAVADSDRKSAPVARAVLAFLDSGESLDAVIEDVGDDR